MAYFVNSTYKRDVWLWPLVDIEMAPDDVRFRG
jgi:hypothetical protein